MAQFEESPTDDRNVFIMQATALIRQTFEQLKNVRLFYNGKRSSLSELSVTAKKVF
jgi:hypothetical protein